ncbi:MAG: hypothetical protein AAF721_17790 [Myxococcota bacterium]
MEARLGKVWSQTPDHAIGEWNNTLLTTWRDTVTVEALEITRVASHDLFARNPGGLLVFNIIPHAVPIPPTEVRKKASDVLGETGGHVLATVTVIEGEGFWTSAARAAVATITLFSRTPHPHRVFPTIEDGARWGEDKLAEGGTAELLVAVAQQLRTRVERSAGV